MILAAPFHFHGSVELFDENETGDLMGEGEWGEAPLELGLLK